MKKRDLVYLLLAVTIFLVAGYLAYTQLLPANSNQSQKAVEVEHVGTIPASLDGPGLSLLKDSSKTQDFNSPEDLKGLGNKAPFGP